MNKNEKNCPICPNECDLASPQCERGEDYARTGKIPEGHGKDHGRGRAPRLSFESREQQLIMKYLHHAVAAADCGGISQEQANEIFAVLTEDETRCLAKLLEKLSDHWTEIAPNKPSHHGRH